MRSRRRLWIVRLMMIGLGGWLCQAGCFRDIQREVEILLRPEANLGEIRNSVLVNLFGPKILEFW